MVTNIEEMKINIEKMRREMRWETRKVALQTVIALAAVAGAGVAVGRFLLGQ